MKNLDENISRLDQLHHNLYLDACSSQGEQQQAAQLYLAASLLAEALNTLKKVKEQYETES